MPCAHRVKSIYLALLYESKGFVRRPTDETIVEGKRSEPFKPIENHVSCHALPRVMDLSPEKVIVKK